MCNHSFTSICYYHPVFVDIPMNDDPKAVCGARNRQGKPCQKSPVTGRTRCRLHGGATPKGVNAKERNGNYRHGLYSKRLTEEEQALLPTIKVGSLDDEITIARIILHRLVEIHEEIQAAPMDPNNPAGFYTAEISITTPDGTTATMKTPETYALMDRYLGRIARLELTRARLIAAMRDRGEGGGEWQPLPWVDWMPRESPPDDR
jgi:hypothetical protein